MLLKELLKLLEADETIDLTSKEGMEQVEWTLQRYFADDSNTINDFLPERVLSGDEYDIVVRVERGMKFSSLYDAPEGTPEPEFVQKEKAKFGKTFAVEIGVEGTMLSSFHPGDHFDGNEIDGDEAVAVELKGKLSLKVFPDPTAVVWDEENEEKLFKTLTITESHVRMTFKDTKYWERNEWDQQDGYDEDDDDDFDPDNGDR